MAGDVFMRPRAKEDIIEQALHIAEDNPDAADGFLDAVEQALGVLADMPEIGAPRAFDNPALQGMRMWPLKGFEKHLLFYRPIENGIEVIRILHAARDIQSIFDDDA